VTTGPIGRTSAADLRAVLLAGGELAVLDGREQGQFSAEHLFWGSCVPLSQLERLVADLVPRRGCPVVWVDSDGAAGGPAHRAALRLAELGWTNVSVLEGGVAGWPGERYSGVNVPSKAFGEWIEHQEATPHLSAADLARRQASGERLVVLDSRPMREFQRMSIPGGIDCPGAELVYRVHDLAPDPTTTVVVNCAGRTRSIIGAQSLRNAGLPNPVVALEHGTMGWELAGLTLARGETTHAADPSPAGLAWATAAADRVAERFAVPRISAATVHAWLADPERTTFVLDVRTAEEYEAGHAPIARHAPGGQVVQAADEYIGVLGARVVLVDDHSLVRATMTASWLQQLGRYEVAVAHLDDATATGPRHTATLVASDAPSIDTSELAAALDRGAVTVIDLADSLRYRRGHIPGAWWAVRARFDAVEGVEGINRPVVLTSPDGGLAQLAHGDADARWPGARVLEGGTNAWTGAGRPLEAGMTRPTTETDDVWYKPYDAADAAVARRHMEEYLRWEVALLDQIERDELVQFRRPG
jgi:rhodanese-related sulfurtransferase